MFFNIKTMFCVQMTVRLILIDIFNILGGVYYAPPNIVFINSLKSYAIYS